MQGPSAGKHIILRCCSVVVAVSVAAAAAAAAAAAVVVVLDGRIVRTPFRSQSPSVSEHTWMKRYTGVLGPLQAKESS